MYVCGILRPTRFVILQGVPLPWVFLLMCGVPFVSIAVGVGDVVCYASVR